MTLRKYLQKKLNKDMNEEKTYYEKILVSSGEVPEDGIYDFTSHGQAEYINGGWRMFKPLHGQWINVYPEWYMKPVPSPKQEAVEFADRVIKRCNKLLGTELYRLDEMYYPDDCIANYTLSELYDKFKEKGEK